MRSLSTALALLREMAIIHSASCGHVVSAMLVPILTSAAASRVSAATSRTLPALLEATMIPGHVSTTATTWLLACVGTTIATGTAAGAPAVVSTQWFVEGET